MDTRLKLTGGEINVSSDEINLMPESTRELFTAMVTQLTGGNPCVISGCSIDFSGPGDPIITNGYVFINGKLLKVEQHTIVDYDQVSFNPSNPNLEFDEITINDPEGLRDFRDGNQKNVYLKERAVVKQVITVTGLQYLYDFFTGLFSGDGLGGYLSPDLAAGSQTNLIGTNPRIPKNEPIDFSSLGVKHFYNQDFQVVAQISTNHFSIPTGGIDLRVVRKITSNPNIITLDFDNQTLNTNDEIILQLPTSETVEYYWLFQRLSDGALNEL